MSADFWAGYISGAAGIVLGNPLDVLKVRLQAGRRSTTPNPTSTPSALASAPSRSHSYIRPFLLGTAAPVLGYGALNALLFVSYNRTEAFLNQFSGAGARGLGGASGAGEFGAAADQARGANLFTTWLAGAVGGLATWVVSTPTELVKCRAQLQIPPATAPPGTGTAAGTAAGSQGTSSLAIAKSILRTHGIRGLYFGGAVTALRDSIGYGFYFWGYELCSRWMHTHLFSSPHPPPDEDKGGMMTMGTEDAARVLLCGGLAGIITWASIFPLDVVKTRVQTQAMMEGHGSGTGTGIGTGERTSLLVGADRRKRSLGAWEVAKLTYREGGTRPFFRGLTVCSVRAFIVNAVQWAVYEWIMMELGQGRRRQGNVEAEFASG